MLIFMVVYICALPEGLDYHALLSRTASFLFQHTAEQPSRDLSCSHTV